MRSIATTVLAGLLFAVGKSGHDNSSNVTWDCNFDWDVDFVGKSGQFKLYPCDESNFFIKVKLERIQSYDNDGSAQNDNKQTTFAYSAAEDATYSQGNSSVYSYLNEDGENIALGGVTLTYEFDVNGATVDFTMNVLLIEETTYVEYKTEDNETAVHELTQGNIKFDFDISNWPFNNDDDSLAIEVKLTTGGTTNDGSEDDESNGAAVFSWGDEFEVVMPETYEHVVGDTHTSKDVTVEFDASNSGKQATVVFWFSNAGDADEIYYDPWISGSILSSANMKYYNPLIAFAVFMGILATYFY